MKKILDFCNKHKKVCIIFSAILVVIIVAVVVVAVSIPSDETDTAKRNAASQTAEISDSQDKESVSTSAAANTGVTETDSTGTDSTDSSKNGTDSRKDGSVNTGGKTSGSRVNADGSGSSSNPGSSKTPSGTGSNKSESGGSSGGSAGNSHQHIWKDHVKTVTVVDEPEQSKKVTEYRMYYWDSKTWKTSEDPDVFKSWERQKIEWMSTYRNENNMPPELFKGYDKNGNPQYTNDHSIVTYYKNIPAVTHEEQRVDYQYCTVCGIKK